MKQSEGSNFLLRHGDKGSWVIDQESLRMEFDNADAQVVAGVFKSDFPKLKNSPLKLEGIKRSLIFAQKIYEKLPENSVILFLDSKKPRAALTSKLISAKLHQLDRSLSSEVGGKKRVDLAEVEAVEFSNILSDASEETWGPFAKMMEEENISEEEALSRWMNSMKETKFAINPEIHPHEAADRYRSVVKKFGKA